MFTVVAFDADGNVARATLTELTGEPDDHLRVVGNDIYIPDLNRLIGAYALHRDADSNGDASEVQLTTPSMRAVFLQDIPKIDTQPLEHNPEVGLNMFPLSPIPLRKDEALNALMANSAVATTRAMVGVFLADGVVSPVRGEIRTLRCTTTLTGVAGEWASGNITFGQDLPVGRYQIVGASVWVGGTIGLFRFIPVGGRWRPGGLIKQSFTYGEPDIFRYGNLGVWMEFDQLTPPRLEVLETNAIDDPVLYLDLIKIS